jgi:acylphosphatase
MASRVTRKYLISGRVQGVGYRVFAQRTARDLGVRGWARNLEDGRVEVLGIGSSHQLNNLEGELRLGPPAAEVRHVVVEDETHTRETGPSARIEGFHIR